MMRVSLVLALFLGAHVVDGASLYQDPSSALISDLQNFRCKLVDDIPNEFYDLEIAVNNLGLGNRSGLMDEIHGFREELTKMTSELQRKLYEIELTLNDEFEKGDDDGSGCGEWQLAMNINPDDGHIMGYGTGWGSTASIGTRAGALSRDYKNQDVWAQPANYISIVRHQSGIIDAVKVYKFIEEGVSLFTMFSNNAVGAAYHHAIVTEGGPIQFNRSPDAGHMSDDPIFSVAGGDLLFNWFANGNDGVRITSTSITHLFTVSDKFYGIAGNYAVSSGGSPNAAFEQDVNVICTTTGACRKVQGRDHGTYSPFDEEPVHGNYAIYVSQDATRFLNAGQELQTEIDSCG